MNAKLQRAQKSLSLGSREPACKAHLRSLGGNNNPKPYGVRLKTKKESLKWQKIGLGGKIIGYRGLERLEVKEG